MLLCAVTTWAEVTDLPEMSTDGDIKWYTIKNTRSTQGGYLYYTASGVKDTNTRTAASFFSFANKTGRVGGHLLIFQGILARLEFVMKKDSHRCL